MGDNRAWRRLPRQSPSGGGELRCARATAGKTAHGAADDEDRGGQSAFDVVAGER